MSKVEFVSVEEAKAEAQSMMAKASEKIKATDWSYAKDVSSAAIATRKHEDQQTKNKDENNIIKTVAALSLISLGIEGGVDLIADGLGYGIHECSDSLCEWEGTRWK